MHKTVRDSLVASALWTAISAAALTVFGGCGAVKNMEEMHDATVHMDGTTTDMAERTNGLAVDTKDMKSTTHELLEVGAATYEDLRQGNSVTIRSERLKTMEESDSMEGKLSEAGKFMMAMEFQLWKMKVDEPKKRETLYEEAVSELMRSAKNYITDYKKVSPASASSKMHNLYALASALHRINPNQAEQAKRLGFRPVSMLDILEEGLAIGASIKAGNRSHKDIPAHVREVLRAEPEALYLMRLRHNFLGAMPLADVSRIKVRGFLGLGGLFRKLDMRFTKWDAHVQNLNLSQLEYNVLKLEHSIHTENFLKQIGEDPMTSKSLVKIWGHMRVDYGSDEDIKFGRGEQIKKFKQAVETLIRK